MSNLKSKKILKINYNCAIQRLAKELNKIKKKTYTHNWSLQPFSQDY